MTLIPAIVIVAPRTTVVIEEGATDLPSLEVTAPPQPAIDIQAIGLRGQSGAGATVYEESFVGLDTWIVNHNLGRKPAAVQILTPGGAEVLAEVLHISDNQLRVFFVQPFTGSVRIM